MSTVESDTKTQWKTAKTILNWKKPEAPAKLLLDNVITSDTNKIKETMNLYYRDKPLNIINKLPKANNDLLINYAKIHKNMWKKTILN